MGICETYEFVIRMGFRVSWFFAGHALHLNRSLASSGGQDCNLPDIQVAQRFSMQPKFNPNISFPFGIKLAHNSAKFCMRVTSNTSHVVYNLGIVALRFACIAHNQVLTLSSAGLNQWSESVQIPVDKLELSPYSKFFEQIICITWKCTKTTPGLCLSNPAKMLI